MNAIGVFGGTFAPFHNGHLRLAIELKETLGLACVHVVPSARPPHRAAPGVSAERRLEWARLAVSDEPGLLVDDREVLRAQAHGLPSYTYDTLVDLHTERAERPLFLLLGDDAAHQLHTWHRWRELFDFAHLIVVQRPRVTAVACSELAPELETYLRSRRTQSVESLHAQAAGLWLELEIPPLAISSTQIRALLKAGRSIRGLVPEAVIRSLTPEDVTALTIAGPTGVEPAHD